MSLSPLHSTCLASLSLVLAACGDVADKPECATSSDCSDGMFCNGEETCGADRTCVAATEGACADAIACTAETCNETTDQCTVTANDDQCGERETCVAATGCAAPIGGCRALDWRYTAPLSLISSSAIADTTFALTLDTASMVAAGKLQDDCDDLRFVDGNGAQLPYWIERGCNTASTLVWIRRAGITAGVSTVYASFGNQAATAGSNPMTTFLSFWDFESNDLAGWTVGSSNYQPEIGEASTASTTSTTASAGTYALMLRGDAACFGPPFDGAGAYIEREITLPDGNYCLDFDWRADMTGFEYTSTGAMLATALVAGTSVFTGTTTCAGQNCSAAGAWTAGTANTPLSTVGALQLKGYAGDCSDGNVYFDNVRVRSCVAPGELTVTVGAALDCTTL